MTKKLEYKDVKKYIEENSNCILLSTEYINVRTKLKLKCSCGDVFENTFSDIKKKEIIQCKKCAKKIVDKKNTKTYEEAYKSIFDKIGDKYEIIPFEYKGKQKTNVELICKKCGEKFIRNYHRINQLDIKCPNCESRLTTWTLEKIQDLINEYSDEFEVVGCKTSRDIEIKHKECGHIFHRGIHNIQQNECVKCPNCDSKESVGSKEITKWLEEKDIDFIKEYRFKDCKDVRPLPFDFYLPQYNCCIEYDGEQHFKPVSFLGGEEHYIMTFKHDRIKDEYCRNNNIKLLRINYKENKKIPILLSKFINMLIPR